MMIIVTLLLSIALGLTTPERPDYEHRRSYAKCCYMASLSCLVCPVQQSPPCFSIVSFLPSNLHKNDDETIPNPLLPYSSSSFSLLPSHPVLPPPSPLLPFLLPRPT